MQLGKILSILITVVGALDLFFAYKRMTSGFGKVMMKFDKIEEVTMVLLISGIVCLAVGILQLIDKR